MEISKYVKVALLYTVAIVLIKSASHFYRQYFGEDELGGSEKALILLVFYALLQRFFILPREINRILDEREKKKQQEG